MQFSYQNLTSHKIFVAECLIFHSDEQFSEAHWKHVTLILSIYGWLFIQYLFFPLENYVLSQITPI